MTGVSHTPRTHPRLPVDLQNGGSPPMRPSRQMFPVPRVGRQCAHPLWIKMAYPTTHLGLHATCGLSHLPLSALAHSTKLHPCRCCTLGAATLRCKAEFWGQMQPRGGA